jgi:hypothetical protein
LHGVRSLFQGAILLLVRLNGLSVNTFAANGEARVMPANATKNGESRPSPIESIGTAAPLLSQKPKIPSDARLARIALHLAKEVMPEMLL